MKVLKFGGTSVGSPERMRALIPLISSDEKKIVVLSAMSGTTNSLVEIADLLNSGKAVEATDKTDVLKQNYHTVADELYTYGGTREIGHGIINSHFSYIHSFTTGAFTRIQEKAILAQGELLSTSLFHLLLQEMDIR